MFTEPDQQRLHRDVLWSLYSPALIESPEAGFPDHEFYRDLILDKKIIQWPAPKNWQRFRLGRHFEQLWQTALTATRSTTLVAANLPVRNASRTLGEFDLVVNHQGQIEHWELAIKFYLAANSDPTVSDWFGPNPRDCLADKLAHLQNRQLLLSQTQEGRTALATYGRAPSYHARGIVKGRLFYPFTLWENQSFSQAPLINPQHATGWWLDRHAFLELFSDAGDCFVPLNKAYWLSTLTNVPPTWQMGAKAILGSTHCREDFAHHLAIIDPAGNEISRGFVVETAWLEAVTAARSQRQS